MAFDNEEHRGVEVLQLGFSLFYFGLHGQYEVKMDIKSKAAPDSPAYTGLFDIINSQV